MEKKQMLKNLCVPEGVVDAVIDTDTYNEIDDQFALAYLINSSNKINLKAIYAAPFHNEKSYSPSDGMKKSYDEIMKILDLMEKEEYKSTVFHGADRYMGAENSPVESDAMRDLVERARQYTPDNPLYVIAIAAITDVASAIVAAPDIADKIVVVWLGGHDIYNNNGCAEFNMMQDVAAARVIFNSSVPLVQLPCNGVVSSFSVSEAELEMWFKGKNKICDFLVGNVMRDQEKRRGKPWTRIIWDVTAVAWLLNDRDAFMESTVIPCHVPDYELKYTITPNAKLIRYVNFIKRDNLLEDLVEKLTK